MLGFLIICCFGWLLLWSQLWLFNRSWPGFSAPPIVAMFAWYDLWVGVFIDKAKRKIYVFPVPCFGVRISY